MPWRWPYRGMQHSKERPVSLPLSTSSPGGAGVREGRPLGDGAGAFPQDAQGELQAQRGHVQLPYRRVRARCAQPLLYPPPTGCHPACYRRSASRRWVVPGPGGNLHHYRCCAVLHAQAGAGRRPASCLSRCSRTAAGPTASRTPACWRRWSGAGSGGARSRPLSRCRRTAVIRTPPCSTACSRCCGRAVCCWRRQRRCSCGRWPTAAGTSGAPAPRLQGG